MSSIGLSKQLRAASGTTSGARCSHLGGHPEGAKAWLTAPSKPTGLQWSEQAGSSLHGVFKRKGKSSRFLPSFYNIWTPWFLLLNKRGKWAEKEMLKSETSPEEICTWHFPSASCSADSCGSSLRHASHLSPGLLRAMWNLSCLSLPRGRRVQTASGIVSMYGLRTKLSKDMARKGTLGESLSSLNQVTVTVMAKQWSLVTFLAWAVRQVFLTHSNAKKSNGNCYFRFSSLMFLSHSCRIWKPSIHASPDTTEEQLHGSRTSVSISSFCAGI